jgi:hypothetical protein
MNGPVVIGIVFILGVCAIFVAMCCYKQKEGFSPTLPPDNFFNKKGNKPPAGPTKPPTKPTNPFPPKPPPRQTQRLVDGQKSISENAKYVPDINSAATQWKNCTLNYDTKQCERAVANIGSIAKTLTKPELMQLVGEGKDNIAKGTAELIVSAEKTIGFIKNLKS